MFNETAVNFNHYFWTPYSFLVLAIVILLESFLVFKVSPKTANISFKRLVLTCLFANLSSFLLEYYLFLFLNGGHRTLVWIPWVKIINRFDLDMYVISFPIIFLITIAIEFFGSLIVLRKRYTWKQVLRTTFVVNLISTLLLIIVFNCIVFNIVNGEKEGYWDDILPELPLKK